MSVFPQPITKPISVHQAIAGAIAECEPPPWRKFNRWLWSRMKPGKPGLGGRYFSHIRIDPTRPSPTIIRPIFGGFAGLYHWNQPRSLNLGELRRLGSFPEGFRFVGGYEDGLNRIGNSVPPLFMFAIAAHLRRALLGGDVPVLDFTKPYPQILDDAWKLHLAPRAPDAPTVISTFAGCGGSSLGYSMAGYRELLAVEWDDNAVETFRLNFPEVPVFHGDIAKLSVEDCLRTAGVKEGELDVFDGSPPCQGFSTAGNREFHDPRNSLFEQYVRLLRGLRPKCFVMENVSGMVKGKMKLIFARIMQELKASGYRVRARLLNAMYFGVPQSRERMIFIGVREDVAQSSGAQPGHPVGPTWPTTVWQAIGHLGDQQDPARGHIWVDESPHGRNTKTWIKARRAKPGRLFAGQKRRQRWDRPADTLTTGGTIIKEPYIRSVGCHPQFTRTYSLLEYRLLASFPEAFQFAGPMGKAIHRIGNSVPPLFMRAVADHVRRHVLRSGNENAPGIGGVVCGGSEAA